MKKAFRKLHLWLSLPFGLLISIICLSGAALVFEDEIMELLYPERYFVKEYNETVLPVEELMAIVSKTLPDSVAVAGVNISSDPTRAYQVNLTKPRRSYVYVNQYTGEVKPRYERAAFFTIMFRTHRWLLDSMKPDGGIFWGKMIVGTSTLLFVFILITGIVIWIPRTYKALKSRLKITVSRGWKRFWYDLHLVGGFYTFVILLVLALTGLTWSFSWYRNGFYKVFGVETTQQQGHGHGGGNAQQTQVHGGGNAQQGHGSANTRQAQARERGNGNDSHRQGTRPENAFSHWQRVYDELSALNPDYKRITVSKGTANVTFDRMGNQRASDRYTFDARTGEITGSTLYKDLDKSGKIRGWIYSVHVGSWGGMFTRIITFFAALIGGTLPLTGYYLWIKKELKKRKNRNKKRIAVLKTSEKKCA